MDTFSRTVDDVLMMGTVVFAVMFVAMVMASAGIYQLITHLKRRGPNDFSEQALSNAIQGRVIAFYVPDNFRAKRQGDARVSSQFPASKTKRRIKID